MSLQNDLKAYYGSEQLYHNPLYPKLKYTDGVRYFATQGQAY